MYSFPSTSQICEPLPRSMKRGVPPTERNARTGEFTPPGMTFWARSNSASLVDTARDSDFGRVVRQRVFHGLLAFLVLAGRQRPEEAVGDDAAHAGPEAGVQALVEELQRLADGGLQLGGGAQQGGHRGREGVAGADEGGLEHLELLARERALRRRQHVVDVLARGLW